MKSARGQWLCTYRHQKLNELLVLKCMRLYEPHPLTVPPLCTSLKSPNAVYWKQKKGQNLEEWKNLAHSNNALIFFTLEALFLSLIHI